MIRNLKLVLFLLTDQSELHSWVVPRSFQFGDYTQWWVKFHLDQPVCRPDNHLPTSVTAKLEIWQICNLHWILSLPKSINQTSLQHLQWPFYVILSSFCRGNNTHFYISNQIDGSQHSLTNIQTWLAWATSLEPTTPRLF